MCPHPGCLVFRDTTFGCTAFNWSPADGGSCKFYKGAKAESGKSTNYCFLNAAKNVPAGEGGGGVAADDDVVADDDAGKAATGGGTGTNGATSLGPTGGLAALIVAFMIAATASLCC